MSLTIQKAITGLESLIGAYDDIYDYEAKELWPVFELAVTAIREKAEREDPMPLTLEELRQMDGEPVWIKADHYGLFADVVKIRGREDGDCFVGVTICYRMQENGYGKTWIAYRHKPKEG